MSNPNKFSKLYRKLCEKECFSKRKPSDVNYNDAVKLVEAAGFTVSKPPRGSHYTIRHKDLKQVGILSGIIQMPVHKWKIRGEKLKDICKVLRGMIELGVIEYEN